MVVSKEGREVVDLLQESGGKRNGEHPDVNLYTMLLSCNEFWRET